MTSALRVDDTSAVALTNSDLPSWLSHVSRLPAVIDGVKGLAWRFPSYENMLKTLGHADGMAEVMAIAIKDFIEEASQSGDPEKFLKERVHKYKIYVSEFDTVKIPIRAANLFVAGAYEQFEGYLYDVVEDYEELMGTAVRKRKEKEPPLDYVLDVLPGGLSKNKLRIWHERYLMLEYFRHVRNLFAHPRRGDKAVLRARDALLPLEPLLREQYRAAPPNPPDSLTIDDFLLFTRLIKYLATDLCRIMEPQDDMLVEHAVRQSLKPRSPLAGLPTAEKNIDKRLKKVAGYYRNRFRRTLPASIVHAISERLWLEKHGNLSKYPDGRVSR
ncbi:hypothetical protein HB774_34685 (plasmid) [Rhizobium leguminosarum bv. viciae]|nr:hypothetical protein HB774_34685 [Rhizobium leguminosarum bv. viciae]